MKHLAAMSLGLVMIMSAGCTTMLAPAYDQSIANELVAENNDIQALLVSVGTEVPASTYPAREPAYDHVIAELNATELQIRARPLPSADALKKTQAVLGRLHLAPLASADPGFSDYPSARSIHDLSDSVTHMRDADKADGLRGGELNAFKNSAKIFLTQAITYETFLKR